MNNKKLQSSSAIFIAAVLVAGVIAIASPVTALAEEYKEKKYDSYDPKERDNKGYGSHYDGFKCYANNFNINKFNSKEIVRDSTATAAEAQQLDIPSELTSPGLLDSIFGGGLDIHIKNICFNFCDNSFGGFVGVDRGQPQ